MSSATTYRPEIDGLRAIAVTSVIIFHAKNTLLPGGFVGVDIFFVISGFLITTIITRELSLGRFTIAGFYDRRVRRIFPALFAMVLTFLPVAWILMTPGQLKDFSQSVLATGLFLSNVYFFLKTGYFEARAEELPMLHTWSLAVEEQYYIVYPLILIGVFWLRSRPVKPVLWLLFAASLALCLVYGPQHVQSNFFLLPTRGWELLAGALLAVYFTQLREWFTARPALRIVTEGLGLLGILFGLAFVDGTSISPGVAALPVIAGTVALIAVMSPQTPVGRVLSSRVPVAIGLVSYSAYLWHQPLYAFSRISLGHLSDLMLAALFVATFVLAYLSWRFIERPFRHQGSFSPKKILWGGVAVIVIFAGLGAAGHVLRGVPQRFGADIHTLAATSAPSPRRDECHTEGPIYRSPAQACIYNAGAPTWAMFGDSHGVELALELANSAPMQDAGIAVAHFTFSGCPPILSYEYPNPGCAEWAAETLAYLEASETITDIAIIYRYGFYQFGEHRLNTEPLISFENGQNQYWADFDVIIARLLAAGKRVHVLAPIPEIPLPIERQIYARIPIAEKADMLGGTWAEYLSRQSDTLAHLRATDAEFIPLYAPLCDETNCASIRDNQALYFDDNHLSLIGARQVITALQSDGYLLPEGQP
jgi:peptidoglycan/LPS O-acetylase OafA/YrhL